MAHSELVDKDTESELPFEDFLTYRILGLTSRLNRQAVQIISETCGLRLPEWRCMAMIGRHGQLNLFTISDIVGMDRGLVTRSVQGLVEKDLVGTKRDTFDRRIVLAELTDTGQKMFDHTYPVMQRRQMRLLAALSPSDRKAFYRIMDRLNGAVEIWEEEQRAQ